MGSAPSQGGAAPRVTTGMTRGSGMLSRVFTRTDNNANSRLELGGWEVAPNEHRTLICRFCGGRTCKREDWTRQGGNSAIRGLHSSWVTDDLLAMQRPSTRINKEFNIIQQFKDAGIAAVVNLQKTGEHPLCGDGIHPHGFSYKAEEFMEHGVWHYNFGFVDMDVPSIQRMLNIVHVIDFHINQKQKVAVHCHAGCGRTGIALACALVYRNKLTPDQAIEHVRAKRPGSVETKTQRQFVHQFAVRLKGIRAVYRFPLDPSYTLPDALTRQSGYLHGEEARELAKIPKIIHQLCAMVVKLAPAAHTDVVVAWVDPDGWTEQEFAEIEALKHRINDDDWGALKDAEARCKAALLVDWLDQLAEPVLTEAELNAATAKGRFDLSAVSDAARETLDRIFAMLTTLESSVESALTSRLYERFAFALLHPTLAIPSPSPFRTTLKPGSGLDDGSAGFDPAKLPGLGVQLKAFLRDWVIAQRGPKGPKPGSVGVGAAGVRNSAHETILRLFWELPVEEQVLLFDQLRQVHEEKCGVSMSTPSTHTIFPGSVVRGEGLSPVSATLANPPLSARDDAPTALPDR